jgi:hypothetical protein
MPKGWGAIWGALAVLVATSAHAQDDRGRNTPAAPSGRFAVDAGFDAMMLFGTHCARTGNDISGCTDASVMFGAHIAPAFYLTPHWSIGVRGVATFTGSASDGLLTFWQAEAEGRYHFVNRGRTDVWLGADAGILITTEHVENDELGPPATLTSTTPIFGLAGGAAFPVAEAFRLGPELRGVFMPRSTNAYELGGRGTTFGDQWGVVLAVTGTLLLGS